MTNDTLTLTDFLLARIAEDEARARHLDTTVEGLTWPDGGLKQVEGECGAKRRIVERAQAAQDAADLWTAERLRTDTRSPLPEWARHDAYVETLCALALPYADHPDYREEWKP